jgi:hypothetical protein
MYTDWLIRKAIELEGNWRMSRMEKLCPRGVEIVVIFELKETIHDEKK